MDFLKKNPYPLAAYCFGAYSILRVFNAGSIVSTLFLLGYIFLTVMLFMKRRDILMVVASAVPSVVNLLSILIYGTSFVGFLRFVADLLVPAYVACFLLPQLEPHVGKYMEKLKKFWFVPAAAGAVLYVLQLIIGFINAISIYSGYYFYDSFGTALAYNGISFLSLLMNLLIIGGNLLLCSWMVWPDGLPEELFASKPAQSAQPTYNPNTGSYEQPAPNPGSALEFSLIGHILLLVFLGGIWQYIWIYRVTKALNDIPGEENRNPVTKLLLCMFVPFYYIYWIYKSCKRIDKLAAIQGVSSDITTLCLILSFFIGIVPPIIMQEKMNSIAATYTAGRGYTAPTYTAPSYNAPAYNTDAANNGGSAYGSEPAYHDAPASSAVATYSRPSYDEDSNCNEKETYGKAPAQISAPAEEQPAAPVYNAPAYDAAAPAKPAEVVQPADDVVEQLKKYKQLLDSGIITQEEFNAKKRQLLNL